jgi:hypothetical protein
MGKKPPVKYVEINRDGEIIKVVKPKYRKDKDVEEIIG